MTTRRTRLEVEVNAKDNASDDVRRVADVVDEVEGEHTVDVKADGDQATREFDELRGKLERLNDTDKIIALRGNADHLEREIARAERALGRVDKYDDKKIDLLVDARDRATAKLDKVQAELRQLDGEEATVRVEAPGLDGVLGKLDELTGSGGALSKLGAAGGPAAGLGALAAGFALAGDKAANMAVEVDNVAKLTGDTTEFASRLAGVMGRVGVETTDLQDILLQMGDVLADDVELAEQLGVNLNDGAALGERFVEVVELLGTAYPNATDRAIASAKLFGEEGVRQVSAVTAMYGDLGAAVDEFNGKVFTPEEAERAREYKRALSEVRGELELIALEIGGEVTPALGGFLQGLQDVDEWIANRAGGRGLFEAMGDTLLNPFNQSAALVEDWEKQVDESVRRAAKTITDRLGDAWLDVAAAARDALGVTRDELAELEAAAAAALDKFTDPGWERFLETQRQIAGALDGAPGLFDELVAAVERGLEIGNRLAGEADQLRDPAGDRRPVTFRVAGDQRPFLTGPDPRQTIHTGDVIIYNPPGTPAATADNQRVYDQRNGYR